MSLNTLAGFNTLTNEAPPEPINKLNFGNTTIVDVKLYDGNDYLDVDLYLGGVLVHQNDF